MIYLFTLLFAPKIEHGQPIPDDVFGRASRWVMQRRWAQRVCALWILVWLAAIVAGIMLAE